MENQENEQQLLQKKDDSSIEFTMNITEIDANDKLEYDDRNDIIEEKVQEKRVLNWKVFLCLNSYQAKKHFYDEQLLSDAIKFQSWDKDMEFSEKKVLLKDLVRCRQNDEFFKKKTTQDRLQQIVTFYCQQNFVNYQQGMLELVIPFLLLRNKTFKLPKCYAYFSGFMKKFFPTFLIQKSLDQQNQLPHLKSAIYFCEILLRYHNCYIGQILDKTGCDLTIVVTKFVVTLFASDTEINLVFIIFDKFMKIANPNFIFFLVVALILMKEKEILKIANDDEDEILFYFNKNIKNIKTEQQIDDWFEFSQRLYDRTPTSFQMYIKSTGFNEKNILSQRDIRLLLNLQSIDYLMPIYISEVDFILNINPNDSAKKQTFSISGENELIGSFAIDQSANNIIKENIQMLLVDIRLKKKKKLKDAIICHIKNNKEEDILKQADFILNSCNDNIHLCLVTDNFQEKREISYLQTMLGALRSKKRNYISVLVGGYYGMKSYINNKYEPPKKKGFCEIY